MTDHDALVDKTNALLEETERLGDTWHSGKDSTESVRQLRILASGYIASLEKVVSSLGECMNQVLDENERLNYANQEIARAAFDTNRYRNWRLMNASTNKVFLFLLTKSRLTDFELELIIGGKA